MSVTRAPQVAPLGDSAVVVDFGDSIDPGTHARVLALSSRLTTEPPAGLTDHVPAYASVTVHYDALACDYATFAASIRSLLDEKGTTDNEGARRHVEIPVCYGGEFGPDIEFVASHNGINADEVARLHSGASYVVYMIGFAPGFPYLGGLPPQLASPRLDDPRAAVPAGSVGIAGRQTGVYPVTTPGGWRIIGRTPTRLFDPSRRDPSLLQAGDIVSFRSIDRPEFDDLMKEVGA